MDSECRDKLTLLLIVGRLTHIYTSLLVVLQVPFCALYA